MRRDAEAHADEDRKRKELIEARNGADNMVYAAEKALRDVGDKVPTDVRAEVEAKVAEAKSALQGEDVEKLKAATEALGQVIQKIGAAAYEQGGQSAPGGEAEPEVVDGEVRE
jgi:molecular chaperone DnaK